jgi:hypothetical protein
MSLSRLTALALAALLSSSAFAGTTGPTNPVEKPKAPAIQSAPGINTDGAGIDNRLPDTETPDSTGGGLGSSTSGNSGKAGGISQ